MNEYYLTTHSPSTLLICSGSTSAMERIDPSNDTASFICNSSLVRYGGHSVSDENNTWFAGGSSTGYVVERINNASYTAEVVPSSDLCMPMAGGCGSNNNSAGFMGGGTWGNELLAMDFATGISSVESALQYRVARSAAVQDVDRLFCIGGTSPIGEVTSGVQVYGTSTSTWTSSLSLLPTGRSGHSSVMLGSRTWIGGGTSPSGLMARVDTVDTSVGVSYVGFRSFLTGPRQYMTAMSNASYCWWMGGQISPEISQAVDRTDLSNDTTDALYRCSLASPRWSSLRGGDFSLYYMIQADADILSVCSAACTSHGSVKCDIGAAGGLDVLNTCSYSYILGGQNYTNIFGDVIKLSASTDIETVVNSNIRARYAGCALSSPGYVWHAGGLRADGSEDVVVDKLDLSSDTSSVLVDTAPAFSNTGAVSVPGHVYVKDQGMLRVFDTSTETWANSASVGDEIFVGGCGMSATGVFAGGIHDGVKSHGICRVEFDNLSSSIVSGRLVTPKFGISSAATNETSWFLGGYGRSYLADAESYSYLSSTSTVLSRASLPSTRCKSNASIFADSLYVTGGLRGFALSDVAIFDPYSDTAFMSSRTSSAIVRHSCGVGSDLVYGVRAMENLRCQLRCSVSSTRGCAVSGLRIGDSVQCHLPAIAATRGSTLAAMLSFLPVEYHGVLASATSPAAVLGESNLSCQLSGLQIFDAVICQLTASRIPASDVSCACVSEVYGRTRTHRQGSRTWAGGGVSVNAVERFDHSSAVWVGGGSTPIHRIGAACCSGSVYAWIGGGDTSENIVERLDYSNDAQIVDDRCDLSVARSYLSAAGDSHSCWFIGGASSGGLSGVVDKVDQSNDTSTAIYRATDMHRIKASAEILSDRIVIAGGENGLGGISAVTLLDPSNDTIVASTASLHRPLYDHCMVGVSEVDAVVQHGTYMYGFSLCDNLYVVMSDLPPLTAGRGELYQNGVLFSGGLYGTLSTAGASVYDASTNTRTSLSSMMYRRYSHWMAGQMGVRDVVAMSVCSMLTSSGNASSDMLAVSSAISEDASLVCRVATGMAGQTDTACLCMRQAPCSYNSFYENMWAGAASGAIFRLTYAGDFAFSRSVDIRPRMCGGSTGAAGYIIGGTESDVYTMPYSDATVVSLSLSTNSHSESAATLCGLANIDILGGCKYYDDYVGVSGAHMVLSTVDNTIVRVPDLPGRRCRACSCRAANGVGHLLGGATDDGMVTDSVIEVNTDTGVSSYVAWHLPSPSDLQSSMPSAYGYHILTDGTKFDPGTGTMTSAVGWPSIYGASAGTGSSAGLIFGGSLTRDTGGVLGTVVCGTPSSQIYAYDHHDDTLSVVGAGPTGVFESPSMFPYMMCSPVSSLANTLPVSYSAIARRLSHISAIAGREYTFGDLLCETRLSYMSGETGVACVYDAYESSAILGALSAVDSGQSAVSAVISSSVFNHSSDVQARLLLIDRAESNMHVQIGTEQAGTTLWATANTPNFDTYASAINCGLYIGGSISTRRCSINAVPSTSWTLSMALPSLELVRKTATTGDLGEILHKLIRTDAGPGAQEILQNVSAAFGGEDFMYSITHSRGVKVAEGTLVLPGSNMQVIRLALRMSGTSLWISNEQKRRFYVSCGVDYVAEDGVVCMPMGSSIMIVSLKLAEPLTTMLNFRFKTLRSTGNMQLLPM